MPFLPQNMFVGNNTIIFWEHVIFTVLFQYVSIKIVLFFQVNCTLCTFLYSYIASQSTTLFLTKYS